MMCKVMNDENKCKLINFEDGDFSLDVNASAIEETSFFSLENMTNLLEETKVTS